MRTTPATQTANQPVTGPGTIRRVATAATFAVVAMACAEPAWAQVSVPTSTVSTAASAAGASKVARLIEWDLPAEMDSQPGAMMVDLYGGQGSVWFVTRAPGAVGGPSDAPGARVYRFDVKSGAKRNYATWFSYQLDPALTGVAGGVRKIKASKDKRYVFVRTMVSLQRIDTQGCVSTATGVACPRAVWEDPTSGLSDIVVDDARHVFTAVSYGSPDESYIQRVDTNNTNTNNATRWKVGGSAGSCNTFEAGVGGPVTSSPCLSGIDVHPRNRYLIYYSEPTGGAPLASAGAGSEGAGAIAELNTYNNSVRRWSLAELSAKAGEDVFQPRQLHIDHNGKVWVITGSGHLVSLDPAKNRMSKHMMPGGAVANDPWGIAPDNGMIGYTVNGADLTTGGEKHAVAMLAPDRDTFYVAPSPDNPLREQFRLNATPTGWADRNVGTTGPKEKTVPAKVSPTNDGTFIEALVGGSGSNNDSLLPLGITPDQGSNVGTFFYAVGETLNPAINRIGRVRLPREHMKADRERDDDDCDDDGKRGDDDDDDDDGKKNHEDDDDDNDGKSDNHDDDDDNDGVEDAWDSKDHKEGKEKHDDEDATPSHGHSDKTFSTNSNTLLVVATAQGSDPLSPVTVEIIDQFGQVVATSPTLLGVAVVTFVPSQAGIYTSRAKNNGLTPSKFSTSIITREPWIF